MTPDQQFERALAERKLRAEIALAEMSDAELLQLFKARDRRAQNAGRP